MTLLNKDAEQIKTESNMLQKPCVKWLHYAACLTEHVVTIIWKSEC